MKDQTKLECNHGYKVLAYIKNIKGNINTIYYILLCKIENI